MRYRYRRIAIHLFILIILIAPINRSVQAYQINTHRALSYWAISRADSDVENYLVAELNMPEGLRTLVPGSDGNTLRTITEWVQEGAEREDAFTNWPNGRFVNHFYNPLTKLGLNDLVGGITSGQKIDSMNWGWEGNPANAEYNDWTWNKARQYYYAMLLGESINPTIPSIPGENIGRTFQALGHFIHLIQDCAQPQHTRNDAHTPFEGAPLEEYCSVYYGTDNQLAPLAFEPLPRPYLNLLPEYTTSFMPRELLALWDTWQYRGQEGGLNLGTMGLAEYSHVNFVTDDTMFTGQTVARFPTVTVALQGLVFPQHLFPYPKFEQTNFDQIYPLGSFTVNRLGENVYPATPFRKVVALTGTESLIANFATIDVKPNASTLDIFLTNENRQTHASILLPKAISYSTAALKYFFRGRLDVSVSPSTTLPEWKAVTVTNRSNEPMSGGWAISADSPSGQRQRLFSVWPYRDSFLNPNGCDGQLLMPGQSCTIQANLPYAANYTVVFKGNLGNELHGAVIGKAFRSGGSREITPARAKIFRQMQGRGIVIQ